MIKYNEEITKKEFDEFLEVLKRIDIDTYEKEGRDGFEDLYDYWSKRGWRRFKEKLDRNIEYEKYQN